MKVLQVHTRYREQGGEDQVVAAERALLRSAGHDVRVESSENASSRSRTAAQLAVAVWNPAARRRFQKTLAEFSPHVVHVHNTWFAMSPAVVAAARSAGSRVVMTLHNYRLTCSNALLYRDNHFCEDCVGSHPWHGVKHRCYRGSYVGSAVSAAGIAVHRTRGTWTRSVDRFLALSEFARFKFVASGLPLQKVTTKPNFVNDGPSRSRPPSESRRVLFVGRLSQEKGVDMLLDAWAAARPKNLELAIIGTGPLERSLRRAAVPDTVFLGSMEREAARSEMARARALLLPSVTYEGPTLALLEGLSAGLPVIASDAEPLAEATRPLGAGFSLAVGDRRAWAEGLKLLGHDERLDEASRLARSTYEARYTPRHALAALEEAYRLDGRG